jgi:hypothetical protein
LLRSPSPQHSPRGEGERWNRAGKFGRCGCSSRFLVFRFGGTRRRSSVVSPKHRRMFLPLLGERDGVRGNRTAAVLAAAALDSAPRPKGHMALSHSSFQASGFAGGRGKQMKREFVSCFTTIHSPKRLNLRRNFGDSFHLGWDLSGRERARRKAAQLPPAWTLTVSSPFKSRRRRQETLAFFCFSEEMNESRDLASYKIGF